MKCSVTVRFLIVFLTVVFMVLSGIAGERLYIYMLGRLVKGVYDYIVFRNDS